MATFNISAILTTAHAIAKKHQQGAKLHYTWAKGMSYRQLLKMALSEAWAAAKKAAQPVEQFFIQLSYSDVKLRDAVKRMGGKWDADRKVWVLSCKRHELPVTASCLVNLTTSTNSNAGYNGTYRTPAKPTYSPLHGINGIRYGAEYDGIE